MTAYRPCWSDTYHKVELLREEGVDQDRQAQYRHHKQGSMPAPEYVRFGIIQNQ
jgi:hypothetical protein